MAPQLPETTSVSLSPTEEDFQKVNAAEAAEVAKQQDTFQRSQGDRKRGWHDYQLLVSGDQGLIVNTLSTVSIDLKSYFDDTFNGWNSFKVNGETHIANLVSAPPPYGRFPNNKAVDRVIQATDGAMIFIKPSPWRDTIDSVFEPLKHSYEGKNGILYVRDLHPQSATIKAPTTKELSVINERTRRPVALVILATPEGFPTRPNCRNYEESLKTLRVACAEFMKDYGDNNQVRLFEINAETDKEGLNNVVNHLISDLLEGRGIQFEPPAIRPWEGCAKKENKFDQLNVKIANNKTSFWSKITNALMGY